MSSEKPENIMNDDESIKVLYEGKAPIRADIVFVHGLTGNGLATWEKGDTIWPRDLLPKAVPAARVITWNYDADIMRFFNKTGQNTILKHAENFLLDLAGERAEEDGIEPDRPIIFVGHSLGGLVIKQALITAREHENTMSEDDNYASIIRNTVGIIFLGTPHKGSDQAKWDGIATNLAKVLKKEHNDTIVNALSRGSSALEGLQSSFAGISDRFSYSTFSEEREYPGIGKIVDDESAILYLPKESRNSIPANHLGMSRFASVSETGFKRVVIAIKALLRAAAMRDPIRHNSTPSLTGLGGPAMAPARSYPPAPYEYGRYPSDRGVPSYGYFPPGGGYSSGYGRPNFSPYGSPDLDDRGLPILLDRVSISQSMSDSGTVVGTSPKSSAAPPSALKSSEASKEEEQASHDDVPDEVADEVATGEEAAPEEETAEEQAAEEEQERPVPSPINRDMYVRLVQEFTDKDKVRDGEFKDGIDRINFYRKRVVARLFLEKAKAQIEADHAFSEDVSSEIASRPYSSGVFCNACKETSPTFNHCIICEGGDYDICSACVDKGVKCPGNHPLVKITKGTDENAELPLRPEEESLFPIDDPLEGFNVDDLESIVRTLYLAALLGGHDDIIDSIVQYGTDSDSEVNLPPNFGTSRIRLSPLALAILMGRDDNVTSILTAVPDMLVWQETVNGVAEEEEKTLEETEPLRENMGDETTQQEVASTNGAESTEGDDTTDDSESSVIDDVSEAVAVEAVRLACSHGSAQCTKLLLLEWGQDPLPKEQYLLHDAAEFGHAESVDILVNWGADIEEQRPPHLRTPLVHCAWLNTDIAKVETLLRRRANVDTQDTYKKTALHYAAANNRLDLVQKLVEEKANLELEDDDGNTPIHYVVEQPEHYAIAKLLVQKGTSLKHKNKKGVDPMFLAGESKADNADTYFFLAVSDTFLFCPLLHRPQKNGRKWFWRRDNANGLFLGRQSLEMVE